MFIHPQPLIQPCYSLTHKRGRIYDILYQHLNPIKTWTTVYYLHQRFLKCLQPNTILKNVSGSPCIRQFAYLKITFAPKLRASFVGKVIIYSKVRKPASRSDLLIYCSFDYSYLLWCHPLEILQGCIAMEKSIQEQLVPEQ